MAPGLDGSCQFSLKAGRAIGVVQHRGGVSVADEACLKKRDVLRVRSLLSHLFLSPHLHRRGRGGGTLTGYMQDTVSVDIIGTSMVWVVTRLITENMVCSELRGQNMCTQ